MKKTKIFAGFTAFAFAVSLGFLSCSNNNDDDDEKEVSIYDTNDNLVSSESIAFNILRDLCDLKNEEGDEELPDGWETKSFDSDIGTTFPAEISDGTIRYVACESADAAAEAANRWLIDYEGIGRRFKTYEFHSNLRQQTARELFAKYHKA